MHESLHERDCEWECELEYELKGSPMDRPMDQLHRGRMRAPIRAEGDLPRERCQYLAETESG